MTSMQEMCEKVSEKLKEAGIELSPKEIYEMSPTGELAHVFDLYQWTTRGERDPIIGIAIKDMASGDYLIPNVNFLPSKEYWDLQPQSLQGKCE